MTGHCTVVRAALAPSSAVLHAAVSDMYTSHTHCCSELYNQVAHVCRYSTRLYIAYTTMWAVGSLLAMQVRHCHSCVSEALLQLC